MTRLILLLCLLSASAFAQSPLSADEFQTMTEGRILYYGIDGERYGVEEYLPDRRVRWSYLDGKCSDGHWYEDSGLICFVYEHRPDPQCWSFFDRGGKLAARFESGDQTEFYEIEGNGEMLCLGPEVGV